MTLLDQHPEFCPTDVDLKDARAQLETAYTDYTSHVSPSNMAMSLQACSYILWLAQTIGARKAIDFGSGFTSYLLRTVCDDVTSVDDSSEWLAWSGRFLERYSLNNGSLMLWDDDYEVEEHDLVVYDFSCGQMRDDHFFTAIASIAPGGVAVLDDAMHIGHQQSMRKAARAFHYDIFGIREYTEDDIHRFCALVVRP